MLDSNVLIYVLDDAAGPARRALEQRTLGEVVTSAIVYAEVKRGLVARSDVERKAAERLFGIIEPLPFDRAAARRYVALPFRRGSFDRLIAAHALALNLTLITNNERDFADIPDLRVENWTQ